MKTAGSEWNPWLMKQMEIVLRNIIGFCLVTYWKYFNVYMNDFEARMKLFSDKREKKGERRRLLFDQVLNMIHFLHELVVRGALIAWLAN